MLRIDAAYLYEFGATLRPVSQLSESDTKPINIYLSLWPVRESINKLVYGSVFAGSLKTVLNSAKSLIDTIDQILPKFEVGQDWETLIPGRKISQIKKSFQTFEAIVVAEMQTWDLYYVLPKGGFNTTYLTDHGEEIFSTELASKVPGALADLKAATRCIAFELPNAAAFHLHRANEVVLRVYWDNVTGGQNHPSEKNMGIYLRELNSLDRGKKEVREHLKSIKDLHRNPLMHPDQNIESIDQAIDLMAAIRCSIGYMLREIETTPLQTALPLN